MRYALLIVLGLVIGILGTVMVVRAMNSGPDYTHSAMTMIDFHMDGMDKAIKENRCTVNDTLPHLQTMRALSSDIEPIFPDLNTDAQFRQKASNLRASLDAAIAAPPTSCPAVGAVIAKIGQDCKACHSQYRH